MPTFPTLSTNPSEPLGFERKDNTLSSNTEADYVRTRKRSSRNPRIRTVFYPKLSNDDFELLDAFWLSVGGYAEIFDWTVPITGEVMKVRFLKDSYKSVQLATGRWDVNFTLEEA